MNFWRLPLVQTILIVTTPFLAFASTPKITTYDSQKDFEKGQAKGVSIHSLGEIRLAPAISETFKPEMAFVWVTAMNKQGHIFLAGGNNGQVFRVDDKNNASVYFESQDSQIYDLALDAKGNLFVATSPDGRVYKVPPGGKLDRDSALFFDPKELYIWSLSIDKSNNLFVATGEKGNIYKVDQSGTSSLFYESEDTHVRKIILDRDGNLIAGTSDKGIIMKIDSKGQAFVLYDSPMAEVNNLLLDKEGNIFASVSGESAIQVPPRPTPAGADKDESGGGEDEEAVDLTPQEIAAAGARRFGKDRSALYRIGRNGTVSTFWQSTGSQIFAMTMGKSGNIILGTGEPAKLYSLTEIDEYTLLNEFEELQMTALAAGPNGEWIAAASNPGKLYRSGDTFGETGEYISEVIDASITSQWGEIHWEADLPNQTNILFFSRSGNTEEPDKSWSAWSESYSNPAGQSITSAAARFLQLKAVFSTKNPGVSPTLGEFTFSYLQKNIPPRIQEISILSPGEYYPDAINNSASESHLGNGQSSGHNGASAVSSRKTFQKGYRSVSWRAQDDNDDQLGYDLYYKGTEENSWKTLVKDFGGRVFSWDSELFPDGLFVIKVVAQDKRSNPAEAALTTEKISQPFKVDNTGPQVTGISVQKGTGANAGKIIFLVDDAMTNVTSVEYGINAEAWQMVYPIDGICDSKNERFEIESRSFVSGENTIVIKATDALGNIGFGKTKVRL